MNGGHGRRPGRGGRSLVARFGLISFLFLVVLGFVVGTTLRDVFERRHERAAVDAISMALDFIVGQQLDPAFGSDGTAAVDPLTGVEMTADRTEQLRATIRVMQDTGHVVATDAWLPNGFLVFSSDPAREGDHEEPAHVGRALAGEQTTRVLDDGDAEPGTLEGDVVAAHGKVLVVTVPVIVPLGDVELRLAVVNHLPYAPIAAGIADDTRQLVLLLCGGLAVLYLNLFRLVQGASKRLRRQAEENHELAVHDALTGLPNRTLLRDRVGQAIAAGRRTGAHVAVLLLDLDRFKEINDTLGHHHGDLLLQQVGPRLRAVLRDADTIARLGGDEFVVLLPDCRTPEEALSVAHRVADALDEPFVLDGVTLDVEASIGIAHTPDHGDDFDDLLQHADVAMYVAKATHTGISVYAPELDGHSTTRLALLGELRRAIDDLGQIVLHYQPKADVETGAIVGVEALVRWDHPVHGLLPPAEFIPAAERTGLIRPLTSRVLRDALVQLRAWLDDGLDLRVAVNVSARCLLDPAFPDEVASLLAEHDVPAERLELELTESAIMGDPDRALEILTRLSDMGCRLAIDDFGTGYSSMAYLKRLPVDELKIDRAFVTSMHHDASDAAIVRSSVDLARNLSMSVVAEGVETEDVWTDLAALGCHLAQGYYLSRPLAASAIPGWLAQAARSNDTVSPRST